MAGVGPVNKNELTPGIEYTFIFNDEDRIYGMLKTYVANNRGPRGRIINNIKVFYRLDKFIYNFQNFVL